MSSPSETAKLLVEKYKQLLSPYMNTELSIFNKTAKACAIIAVDEIINAYENCSAKDSVHYYQQVKKKIELYE